MQGRKCALLQCLQRPAPRLYWSLAAMKPTKAKKSRISTRPPASSGGSWPPAGGRGPVAKDFRPAWLIGLLVLGAIAFVWFRFGSNARFPTGPALKTPDSGGPSLAAPGRSPLAGLTSALPAGTNNSDISYVEQIRKANDLLEHSQPEQAVELLRAAEKTHPNDEDVHYNLGIALARLGKNDEAIKEYAEAVRILPDYAEAQNNWGNLLLRMGKRDEAIQHFKEAVKSAPDYASAWNNYGTAAQELGRTDEAKEYFKKAVDLDTNYWQAHFNLGSALLQRSEFTDAQAEFDTVLRLKPDFSPAKEALARIASQAGPPMRP
jgi:tetratricopeptide (TPR) repeat protein